jgi:hypothetical protein
MGAGSQEGMHDFRMGDGGRADADQIHLAQQFTPVGNNGAAVMRLGLGAHVGIGIGNGEQLDVFAAPFSSNLAQGLVFGGVMMAEHTGANDGSLQRSIFGHAAAKKQGLGFPQR